MLSCTTRRQAQSVLRNARGSLARARCYSVSGVVTTVAPGTPFDTLVQAIPPSKDVQDLGRGTNLLLLLTPAYAKRAREEQTTSSIVKQVLGKQDDITELSCLTAVVDSLPSAESGNTPSEGLAYIIQDGSAVVTDREALRSTAQRPGSLSFEFKHVDSQSWRLQLPLSQTVFSTGLTSTLIDRKPTTQGETSVEYLENATFKFGTKQEVQLSFPLTQLTTYRTVGHSMGNIVRTVTILEDGSEEPASRNLEKAVAAYFEALKIQPEPVNVWALIVPKPVLISGAVREQAQRLVLSDQALQDLWTTEANTENDSAAFQVLLQRRARLVKVLSGGGGWGKKAGLLSLDPDLEYTTRELRGDHGWQFDFDDDADQGQSSVERQIDQALGASVEEGDGIVFYIAPKLQAASIAASPASTSIFGVADKTESLEQGVATDHRIQHRNNFFGMFSETGMGLQIREAGKLVNRTKLEVPGLFVRTARK